MFRLGKVKSAAEGFLNQYRTGNPASYAAALQAVGGLLILDGFIGIDNPFGSKKRSGIFGSLIGVVFGIVILFFGGLFFNLLGAQNLTADATGQITAIGAPQTHTDTDSDGNKSTSTTCSMTVQYTVSGKEYTRPTKSESSGNCNTAVGNSIAIKYDPANPNDFDTASTVNTINTIKKFTPFIGLFVLLSSGVVFTIRLLSIIFGWKLLKTGRAMAKTLPAGTDLSTVKNEIRQNFAQHLFSFGSGNVQPPVQQAQPQAAAQPTSVPPTTAPQPQPQTTVQPTEPPKPPTNTPQQ